jgi:phage terminase small subunit
MPSTENPRHPMGLTSKQEAYALAYCRLTNASNAYREVYQPSKASAKTVNEAACRLAKNSKVAARVAEIRAAAEDDTMLTIERVRTELARLAFSNIGRVFNDDGSLKEVRDLDDDTAAAIELYEVKERVVDGAVVGRTIRVKFLDKTAALGMAARHLGLFEKDNALRAENVRVMIELVG